MFSLLGIADDDDVDNVDALPPICKKCGLNRVERDFTGVENKFCSSCIDNKLHKSEKLLKQTQMLRSRGARTVRTMEAPSPARTLHPSMGNGTMNLQPSLRASNIQSNSPQHHLSSQPSTQPILKASAPSELNISATKNVNMSTTAPAETVPAATVQSNTADLISIGVKNMEIISLKQQLDLQLARSNEFQTRLAAEQTKSLSLEQKIKELETLQTNTTSHHQQTVQQLYQQIESTQKQANSATINNEVSKKRLEELHHQIQEAKVEISKLKTENIDLKQKADATTADLALKAEINRLTEELRSKEAILKAQKDTENLLKDETNKLKEESVKIAVEQAQLEAQKENLNTQRELFKAQETITALKSVGDSKVKEYLEKNRMLESEIDELKGHLTISNNKAKQLENLISSSGLEAGRSGELLSQKQLQVVELENQLSKFKLESSKLEGEITIKNDEIKRSAKQLTESDENLINVRQMLREMEEKLKTASKAAEDTNMQSSVLKKESDSLKSKVTKLELENARISDALKNTENAIRETGSKSGAIEALLKEKDTLLSSVSEENKFNFGRVAVLESTSSKLESDLKRNEELLKSIRNERDRLILSNAEIKHEMERIKNDKPAGVSEDDFQTLKIHNSKLEHEKELLKVEKDGLTAQVNQLNSIVQNITKTKENLSNINNQINDAGDGGVTIQPVRHSDEHNKLGANLNQVQEVEILVARVEVLQMEVKKLLAQDEISALKIVELQKNLDSELSNQRVLISTEPSSKLSSNDKIAHSPSDWTALNQNELSKLKTEYDKMKHDMITIRTKLIPDLAAAKKAVQEEKNKTIQAEKLASDHEKRLKLMQSSIQKNNEASESKKTEAEKALEKLKSEALAEVEKKKNNLEELSVREQNLIDRLKVERIIVVKEMDDMLKKKDEITKELAAVLEDLRQHRSSLIELKKRNVEERATLEIEYEETRRVRTEETLRRETLRKQFAVDIANDVQRRDAAKQEADEVINALMSQRKDAEVILKTAHEEEQRVIRRVKQHEEDIDTLLKKVAAVKERLVNNHLEETHAKERCAQAKSQYEELKKQIDNAAKMASAAVHASAAAAISAKGISSYNNNTMQQQSNNRFNKTFENTTLFHKQQDEQHLINEANFNSDNDFGERPNENDFAIDMIRIPQDARNHAFYNTNRYKQQSTGYQPYLLNSPGGYMTANAHLTNSPNYLIQQPFHRDFTPPTNKIDLQRAMLDDRFGISTHQSPNPSPFTGNLSISILSATIPTYAGNMHTLLSQNQCAWFAVVKIPQSTSVEDKWRTEAIPHALPPAPSGVHVSWQSMQSTCLDWPHDPPSGTRIRLELWQQRSLRGIPDHASQSKQENSPQELFAWTELPVPRLPGRISFEVSMWKPRTLDSTVNESGDEERAKIVASIFWERIN